ncbi:eukaryotic translation initiation factor 4G-like isoform X1 [Musa acuminata AAA Group]|uniref:eukaryotic translation initiation factor 4G-like isoform X1 n=1 Tax=Musa acuminata AAA Group TaxID=214697 RepID=UPI0031E46742
MSVNQSRAERTQGQLRKPSRSGSSGQQRGSIGSGALGKGGSSAPSPISSSASSAAPSSISPSLSTNRSIKKSGNGHGGQSRINPASTTSEASGAAPSTTAHRAVQNGAQAPQPSPGFSDASVPGGAKLIDMPTPRNASRGIPKSPYSQSATGASSSSTTSAPPKGDTSRTFPLQFGSINPGIVNGLQIPARTSSAPPNLDEQKCDQARIESFGAAPTLPVASIPKQQQQQQARKDVSGAQQSNSVEAHPLPQSKRDVSIPVPSASVISMPKSSVLPIPGMPPMPMPMPFQPHQPQIPPQLGGPSPQMQSPGLAANSLQMTMTLPVGNVPQVAQQIYVPGIQSHFVQQQAMMHQGQGLGFAPPISHQLSQQLGNMGMGISSQFPQQHMGKFSGPRKTTVKITHPETHEVLRLDKRTDSSKDGVSSGQRSLSNVIPQAQPIPTYSAAHQMNYYAPMQQNSYSPSPLIFTTTTVPLTSGQVPMSSQAPKYSYPVSQSGQNLSFMKSSMANAAPGGKPALSMPEAVNLEGLPVSTSLPYAVQINVKGLQSEIVGASSGTPPVVISMPLTEAEPVKSVKTVADATVSCHKNNETSPDGPAQQLKSGSEPLLTLPVLDKSSAAAPPVLSSQRMLSEASSTPESRTGDSGSVQSGSDIRKREPLRRSDSLKDNQKKQNRKDLRNSQQEHQLDVSSPEGAKLSSPKPTKSSYAGELISQEGCTNTENTEAVLASDLGTPSAWSCKKAENMILSEVGATEPFKGEIMPAASGLSGSILEKEASQGTSLFHADSFGSAPDGVSIKEDVPSEVTTSLSPMMDGTNSKSLGTSSCLVNEVLDVMRDEMLDVTKHEKSEVSDASLQDSSDNNVHQPSTTKKSSKLFDPVMLLKQDDGGGNDGKVKFSDYHEADNKQFSSFVVGTKEGERKIANEENKTTDASPDPADSGTAPSNDIRSANDDKDKVDIFTTKCEIKYSEDIGLPDSGVIETAPVPSPSLSEVTQKSESEVVGLHSGLVSATSLRQKEKPSLETLKPKITTTRKKKRKEILSKADAAGTSDLYNAYTGPEEMHETVSNPESIDNSMTDTKSADVDFTNKEVAASEEDGQNKAELDDWEDAADISTPKLKTSEHGHSADGHDYDGDEATAQKKYSRDFLMTLSQQFTELPVGFEIGSDISDALMSTPLGKSPCPSPGRIIDRPSGASRVDRRMVGNLDDEKWTKSPSFGLGRDRLDIGHGAAIVSLRPGQGVSHGVLRNPRGQASNQFGGILSGPTQSVASQGGMPRDADRWQRARGLMPSPQTPLQVMHKAERKYEVGKAVDQEEGKQRQLKAILNKLTPQNFEKFCAQVKEVNIDSAATLTGVISQIFDKALMEPTFCEMYANFCFHLSGALPDFNEDNERITFKRLLLNKCQEEFERGEREQAEANKVEEEGEIKQSEEEREKKRLRARRRMLGNIRLIGELYKKKMLTERIMHECIKKLLGQYQNPDEEDVEALCKLMSTIGEMIDHPKAKEHMDAYFDMMTNLSTNQKLSSRVRFMLRDAIDLRKNKWQQRRKVEGPKKIEEVHRDAAQERQAQSSRLARGPVISNIPRRGQVVDYGSRGSTPLTSPNSQQVGSLRGLPTQARGYGAQDVRLDDRHHFETRTVSLPLPQRSTDDDSITLGPQGGLARGMSTRGHPSISISNVLASESPAVGEHRRLTSGPNGTSYMADRFSGTAHDQVKPHDRTSYYGSRDFKISDHTSDRSVMSILPAGRTHGTSDSSLTSASEIRTLPEEVLREKSILAIREFYSAKDENEVALCIKELNAPSFYPSVISLWVTDSFERKDAERDHLTELIINLCKSRDSLLNQEQLLQGFESVLSSLEDSMNDAPRAAEFLGRIFAKFVMEDMVTLREIGRLLYEGGEEPGRLRETGIAADVLSNIFETIRSEKGGTILNEIQASSNLPLEDFQPPSHPKQSKMDAFL